TITASDNRGGSTTQSFDLPVVPANTNQPPVITSRPRGAIRVGSLYQYAIQATDPNNDPLTYRLATAPVGMAVDVNGLVTWTPTTAQLGANSVNLQVDDNHGGVVGQLFSVVVSTQFTNEPPTITSTPKFAGVVDQLYVYNVTGTDPDNDPLSWD